MRDDDNAAVYNAPLSLLLQPYFKNLMDMTKKARDAYHDMVASMEQEILEASRAMQPSTTMNVMSTIADVPKFFSHMGHSRTPSGCSGISLTSSILSEPISENYPYSEPETDSRGYEIVRNHRNGAISVARPAEEGSGETLEEKLQKIESDLKDLEEQEGTQSPNSSADDGGKVCIVESLCEIDEGNEADTEDDIINRRQMALQSNNDSNATVASAASANDATKSKLSSFDSVHNQGNTDSRATYSDNEASEGLRNAVESSSVASRVDSVSGGDAMSTHSSKTLESCGAAVTTTTPPDQLSSSRNHDGSVTELHDVSATSGSSAHKVKSLDKERIEEWVAKTQQQVEMLDLAAANGPDDVAADDISDA